MVTEVAGIDEAGGLTTLEESERTHEKHGSIRVQTPNENVSKRKKPQNRLYSVFNVRFVCRCVLQGASIETEETQGVGKGESLGRKVMRITLMTVHV